MWGYQEAEGKGVGVKRDGRARKLEAEEIGSVLSDRDDVTP